MKLPDLGEKELEAQQIRILSLAGFEVKKLSQGFRAPNVKCMTCGSTFPNPTGRGGTRQSAGLSDLELFHPHLAWFGKVESKTRSGMQERARELRRTLQEVARLKPAARRKWAHAHGQWEYEVLCGKVGIPYYIGGLDVVEALLIELGLGVRDPRSGVFGLVPRSRWPEPASPESPRRPASIHPE